MKHKLTPPWRRSGFPRSTIAEFRHSANGVSAVEFALILPLMLTLYAGMAEMAHAIDNWRKVTQLARTVADLTSQGDQDSAKPIRSSTMDDILASSSAVLRPFVASDAQIVVSALAVDHLASALSPRVCSSVATSNATARHKGIATDLPIPAGFGVDGNRYVLAEVSMPYTPMIGASLVKLVRGINGSIMLNVSFPWPTRGGQPYKSITNTSEVILPDGKECP